jgi:hypothetical protein
MQIRFPARLLGTGMTKKGGKFGVILGEAGGLDTKTGNGRTSSDIFQ